VIDASLVEFASFSTSLSRLVTSSREELDRIIAGLDVTVDEQVRPRLARVQEALHGLDEMSRAVFLAGRNGEWLNQTILCANTGPPPCLTPPIAGIDDVTVSASSAGRGAATFDDGVDVITDLIGGGPR
jgi:hypothetical protein